MIFDFLTDLFKEKARRPFVTTETIRVANARFASGERAEWPRNVPRITREQIEIAGRKAMQDHNAREAANGGPWWKIDPVFQNELKVLRNKGPQ